MKGSKRYDGSIWREKLIWHQRSKRIRRGRGRNIINTKTSSRKKESMTSKFVLVIAWYQRLNPAEALGSKLKSPEQESSESLWQEACLTWLMVPLCNWISLGWPFRGFDYPSDRSTRMIRRFFLLLSKSQKWSGSSSWVRVDGISHIILLLHLETTWLEI